MRRRDSNPAEASTLAASQVNPPRALLHGHRLAFPNRLMTCVKRTMRQVTTGLVPPQPLVVIVMGMELGTEGLSRSFGFF